MTDNYDSGFDLVLSDYERYDSFEGLPKEDESA
jgi:hypothetical protein